MVREIRHPTRMFRPVQLLILFTMLALPAAAPASDLCHGHRGPGVFCKPGHGRHTAGGNGKVSHAGWPHVTGIYWSVQFGGHSDDGPVRNDELLGLHGDDTLDGGPGRDILWGDQLPNANNTW